MFVLISPPARISVRAMSEFGNAIAIQSRISAEHIVSPQITQIRLENLSIVTFLSCETGPMSETILEVIACSVADAIEAEKGGARRLEVVRALDRGGLTPPVELVRAIKDRVHLPLRVMVRESDGYQTSGESEIEKLCAAADEFSRLDVDGLVLGFLKDKTIDLDLTRRVLAAAPKLKATFHHAFEDAADQLQAVGEIRRLSQVDRILSHGGSGDLEARRLRLDAYVHAATPEITIVAGGGIDSRAIALLQRTTAVREFHVGRAARRGFRVEGEVQSELVRALSTDYTDSINQSV